MSPGARRRRGRLAAASATSRPPSPQVSRDAGGDETRRPDGHCRRHQRDAVLAGELRPARDVDRHDAAAGSAQLAFERAAVGAERMRELDDRLALAARGIELREIDVHDVPRPDAAEPRTDLVHLAPDAETRGRREQGERRDDEPEAPADRLRAERVRDGGRAEERDADHVREARRAAVLDRTFTETRLDHAEVQEARQAVLAPEPQPKGKLRGEQSEDRPPAGEERDERQGPDDRLIRARRARIDDVGVAPRVCASDDAHVLTSPRPLLNPSLTVGIGDRTGNTRNPCTLPHSLRYPPTG